MLYNNNATKLEAIRCNLENMLTALREVASAVSAIDLVDSEPGGYPSYQDTNGQKSLLTDTLLVRRSIVSMLRAVDTYENEGHFTDRHY